MSKQYAVLTGYDSETCCFFIRYKNNQEILKKLQSKLDKVYNFVLDLDNLVCENTARQMIRLNVNSKIRYKKFDDNLIEHINFQLNDSNKILSKICNILKSDYFCNDEESVSTDEESEGETLYSEEESDDGSDNGSDLDDFIVDDLDELNI